ncbi:MAG: DNA methylase N-4 [Candidatus Omnitrophica bacterium 4484_171]|nr:MAG: DNA methylase N-4 [Candidatus Omnitrophica bacterium 4484_171]
MKTNHKIIIGDSRKMEELADNSVQIVITSPPYWQLKDYGSSHQIGFDHSYEDYINNLNLVWNECYRVIEPGCRLCVNIGDQFARSVYYGRYKIIPIRTEIIKFCETIGFDYMGAIIWQKVTTCNTTGGATIMGSFPYPRNGIVKIDYEFILLFKKPGKPKAVSWDIKEKSRMTKEEWNLYFNGHWNFSGARQNKHLAVFPEELPRRLIKMFTFVGDTVLDPFLGSGTTSLAAKNTDRNSVGFEVNGKFKGIIKEKLRVEDKVLFDNSTYEFIVRDKKDYDFAKEIKKLPYIFEDPIKFDKKIDVKKLQYGSKIDENSGKRDRYYLVKNVISPEKVELSNGIRFRMKGVKEDVVKNGTALKFLNDLVKGKRVFLKFDGEKYDLSQNLCGYLYLQNKTFVNAHLIKNHLVKPDTESEYRYKKKFLRLSAE